MLDPAVGAFECDRGPPPFSCLRAGGATTRCVSIESPPVSMPPLVTLAEIVALRVGGQPERDAAIGAFELRARFGRPAPDRRRRRRWSSSPRSGRRCRGRNAAVGGFGGDPPVRPVSSTPPLTVEKCTSAAGRHADGVAHLAAAHVKQPPPRCSLRFDLHARRASWFDDLDPLEASRGILGRRAARRSSPPRPRRCCRCRFDFDRAVHVADLDPPARLQLVRLPPFGGFLGLRSAVTMSQPCRRAGRQEAGQDTWHACTGSPDATIRHVADSGSSSSPRSGSSYAGSPDVRLRCVSCGVPVDAVSGIGRSSA